MNVYSKEKETQLHLHAKESNNTQIKLHLNSHKHCLLKKHTAAQLGSGGTVKDM